MAATHPRRRKGVSRADSASYGLVPNEELRVKQAEFVDTLENSKLTIRQLVYKILTQSGPYNTNQLIELVRKRGRYSASESSVKSAIGELRRLKLVVRVNGGYAIHNWTEIGA